MPNADDDYRAAYLRGLAPHHEQDDTERDRADRAEAEVAELEQRLITAHRMSFEAIKSRDRAEAALRAVLALCDRSDEMGNLTGWVKSERVRAAVAAHVDIATLGGDQ